MGRKYASYHIYRDHDRNDLEELSSIFAARSTIDENIVRATEAFSNPNARNMMERFLKIYQNSIIIVLSEKFISIYDETLSFATINAEVKKISKKIPVPILYTSNFDDDVLLFGLVKTGVTLARKHIGQGLESYGVKPVKSTINRIRDFEEFRYLPDNTILEMSNDIGDCEISIENEFGILLKLTQYDIDAQPENFKQMNNTMSLNVFQKIDAVIDEKT